MATASERRKLQAVKDAAPVTVQASTPAMDAAIERAGEETARMGKAERIHYWDKRQGAMIRVDADGKPLEVEEVARNAYGFRDWPEGSKLVPSPDIIYCGHDRSHGPLIMHGSGSVLICQAVKNGAACTYTQPVSV